MEKKMTAEQAMQAIYDLIFLDEDSKGEFLNPDKECKSCADFFDGVYDVATRWKPVPKQPKGRPVEARPQTAQGPPGGGLTMTAMTKFSPPPQALRVLPDDTRYKNRFLIAGSTGRVYCVSYDTAPGSGYWVCSCPGNISHGDCKHLQACGLIGRKRSKVLGIRAPMYPSRLGS